MYLSAARFGKGNGIKAASDHFFEDQNKKAFSNEEAFFLVERLSSKPYLYSIDRIKTLASNVKKKPDSMSLDIAKTIDVYKRIEEARKIKLF